MGLLKSGGYIKVDENGFITLLEPGREVAEMINERHTLLTQFLTRLGVSPEVAAEDACKLEHVISDESFQAIKRHAHLGVKKWKKDSLTWVRESFFAISLPLLAPGGTPRRAPGW